MQNENFRKILLVGSCVADHVYAHPDLGDLGDFKHAAEFSYIQAGGGGANAAIGMRELKDVLGHDNDIVLCTKIGEPPVLDREAKLAKDIVSEELHGIRLIDVLIGKEYKIPFNSPTSYQGGRFISTAFVESVEEFQRSVVALVHRTAQSSDLVFIHSRYPRLSLIAAEAASQADVPVFYDYSVTSPSSDDGIAQRLLELSTYVVAPGEALLPGMDKADPAALRDLIPSVYGAPYVAISNGTDPVLMKIEGQDFKHPVERVKAIDPLGTGDARNAGALTALLDGKSFKEAIAIGSTIASLSVQYPGRDWAKNLRAFFKERAEFDFSPGISG